MYWFILGREPLLSAAEISAFFHHPKPQISGSLLRIDCPVEAEVIDRLGGTIKIGKEVGCDLTQNQLASTMVKELNQHSLEREGKIVFGISVYQTFSQHPDLIDKPLGISVKKQLKSLGKSVRFVEGDNGLLNAAHIKYNKIIEKGAEFLIVKNQNGKFDIAKTIAVQDVDEFSKRDYGRPGRDDLSGMLPPKLAMMMINLSAAKLNDTILDPFCGSGTILTEAMLMGYQNIIGSDLSKKAVADSQKNIEWTEKISEIKDQGSKIKLLNIDAAEISSALTPNSIDAVITEPYLGKPLHGTEPENIIRAQALELKTLYVKALMEIKKVLKPGGTIVFIVPRFRCHQNWIAIDIKNELTKIGLTIDPLLPNYESILYARPEQKVGREIWRFKKI